MGERGRKGKELSRAVPAADGEVPDRLSRALPNVTYFSGLQRGICLATVLFEGKQIMISSSSRAGTRFPEETLAFALCSAGKGGIRVCHLLFSTAQHHSDAHRGQEVSGHGIIPVQ